MSYRVTVTREAGRWLVDIPELEGTHTWARTLSALDRAVREAVVLGTGLADSATGGLDLDYEFHTGDMTVDQATELRRKRNELELAERKIVQRTETIARDLVARGYSVRDAAVLTGVSYQRVSQLTRKAA